MNRIAEDEKAIILNSVNAELEVSDQIKYEATASLTMYSIFPLNVEKVLEETDEIKPIETVEPAETTAE